MKRNLMILAALVVLAIPLGVWAEDGGNESTIPREMNWTAYPPARGGVDMTQLMDSRVPLVELLVKQGVITSEEETQLTHPQPAMADVYSRERILESLTLP